MIAGELGADDGSIVLGERRPDGPPPARTRPSAGSSARSRRPPSSPISRCSRTRSSERACAGGSAGPFRTFFRTPKARADERRAEERALAALELRRARRTRDRLGVGALRPRATAADDRLRARDRAARAPARRAGRRRLGRRSRTSRRPSALAPRPRPRPARDRAQPPLRAARRRPRHRPRGRAAGSRRARSRRSPPTRPCEPHTWAASLSSIPSPLKRLAFLLVALCALLSACGGDERARRAPRRRCSIAVNAPFSRTPYVGQTIADGAQLAADEANIQTDEGVVPTSGSSATTRGSRRGARSRNVQQAIADGAVAIVDEGTGVDASWRIARRRRPPARDHVPGRRRPGRPRAAPQRVPDRADRPRDCLQARRVPDPEAATRSALIVDDSTYGQEGAKAIRESFSQNPESVATRLTVPVRRRRPRARGASRAPRRAPTRCSSGRSRRRSPASSPPRARRAGTSPSTRRPRARTRSCASSSPTVPSGSTDSPSPRAGRPPRSGPARS